MSLIWWVNLEIPIQSTSKCSHCLRFTLGITFTILYIKDVAFRVVDGKLIAIPGSSSFIGIDPVNSKGIATDTVIRSGATENGIIRYSLGYVRALVTYFTTFDPKNITLKMVLVNATDVIDVIPLATDGSVFHGHGISTIAVIGPVPVHNPSSAGYPAPTDRIITGYVYWDVTVVVANSIYPVLNSEV